MNIVLPNDFYYEGASRENFAKVENGILVIRGTIPFKDMMYDLTYAYRGTTKCYYCGKPLQEGESTLDHMYPLDQGGPTIPNNMVPSCRKCNSEKSNMTCDQYREYTVIEDRRRKRYIKRKICEMHEILRQKQIYQLPPDWVTEIKLYTVIVEMFFDENFKGTKYKAIKEFYEKYGFLKKPIIVNRSHYLFSGFTELMYAREIGLKTIPAIVLENVKVIL